MRYEHERESYNTMEEANITHWDDHWREGWKSNRYSANPFVLMVVFTASLAIVTAVAALL